jgi:hypothetical protein
LRREILCTGCALTDKSESTASPSERIERRDGDLLIDARCDRCNEEQPKGTTVTAFSFWDENHGQRYFPWESEMLDVEDPKVPISADAMNKLVLVAEKVADIYWQNAEDNREPPNLRDLSVHASMEGFGVGWWSAIRAVRAAEGAGPRIVAMGSWNDLIDNFERKILMAALVAVEADTTPQGQNLMRKLRGATPNDHREDKED